MRQAHDVVEDPHVIDTKVFSASQGGRVESDRLHRRQ
jgi:hypothetical protein